MNDETKRAYERAHRYIRKLKGPASAQRCVDCGTQAHHWSRDNDQAIDTRDPAHYVPRCRSCHFRHDNAWHSERNWGRDNKPGSAEHARFMSNMLRNYVTRVQTRTVDGIDALKQLAEIQAQLDERTAEVVLELREQGYSWQQIGNAYGITREAAYRKWVGRAGVADTSPRKPGGQPGALR